MTTTLLAVDDSVTMRKVLEITFGGENYKTVLASSAQEALSLAKTERPALALLDHTLPDMSGYDLARELKAAAPGLAVMILSSKQVPFDKARATASGVDDFMDKPFDTQKLLDKVTQVLAAPRATVGAAPQAAAPAHPVAHAVAPAASPGPLPSAAARPRSQTLSYGTPVPSPAPAAAPHQAPAPVAASSRTLTGTPAATPKPAAAAAPRMAAAAPPHPAPVAAPAAATPRPAPVAAAAVAAAVSSAGNGHLSGKLESLGLSPQQVDAVLALSREVVEQVVWEVVPVLAETIIKEELKRLTAD